MKDYRKVIVLAGIMLVQCCLVGWFGESLGSKLFLLTVFAGIYYEFVKEVLWKRQ